MWKRCAKLERENDFTSMALADVARTTPHSASEARTKWGRFLSPVL